MARIGGHAKVGMIVCREGLGFLGEVDDGFARGIEGFMGSF